MSLLPQCQNGLWRADVSFIQSSIGEDGTAKTWGAEIGAELPTLTGHSGDIFSDVFGVAFSPAEAHLDVSGGDGTVRVYVLPITRTTAKAGAPGGDHPAG